MRLGRRKIRSLEHRPDQLVVEAQHLIQQLGVLDVVGLLITVELHVVRHQLLLGDGLEHHEFGLIFALVVVVRRITGAVGAAEVLVAGVGPRQRAVRRAAGDGGRAVDAGLRAAGRNETLALILQLLQLDHALTELALPLLFLNRRVADVDHALAVDEIAGAGPPGELAIDALPMLLEV